MKEHITFDENDTDEKKSSSTARAKLALVAYITLWVGVSLSVHSTSKEDVKLPTALMVLLVEFLKIWVAFALFFLQYSTNQESSMRDGWKELVDIVIVSPKKRLMPLFVAYTPIALLYVASNNLSIMNLRFFDPATFLLLSSARLLLTASVWQRVFDEKITQIKWIGLELVTLGILVKSTPDYRNQESYENDSKNIHHSSGFLHIVSLVIQLCCTVAASVYNEKILKQRILKKANSDALPSTVMDEDSSSGTAHLEMESAVSSDPHVHNMCLYIIGVILNSIILLFSRSNDASLNDNESDLSSSDSRLLLFRKLLRSPQTQVSIIFLACAGVSTSILLRYLDSVTKAVVGATDPAIVAVISYFLFGYPITLPSVISMILIGFGVYIYAIPNNNDAVDSLEHITIFNILWHMGCLKFPKNRRTFFLSVSVFILCTSCASSFWALTTVSFEQPVEQGYTAAAHLRMTDITTENDVLKACLSLTPECEAEEIIRRKWGYEKEYNQTECCYSHKYIRIATMQVWEALHYLNVTAWADGGTAIGIARHNGTQVPWEVDADINFLASRNNINHTVPGYQSVALGSDTEVEIFLGKLLSYLYQINLHELLNVSMQEELNATLWWTYKIVHQSDYCIQINLYQHYSNHTSGEYVKVHVDLFGVRRRADRTAAVIDGVTRESVDYFGCFQNPKGYQHSFYAFPPVKCDFYGKQVWCPREIVPYLQNYYGENVMYKGVSHEGIYGEDYSPFGGNGI